VEPDVAKLNMSLVRDVSSQPRKQSIVRSLRQLCDDLGIAFVAEGVVTAAERDMLVSLGCDLLQGSLFGRPERNILPLKW
jgi:EAL domain-containing protein (putative c-di-GMP-specific phosphodiesterase class I)